MTADDAASDLNLAGTVYRWVQRADNLSLVMLDVGIVLAAWLLAFAAGFESQIPDDVGGHAVVLLGIPLLIQLAVNKVAGLYGPVWRYASVEEGTRVIVAVATGAMISATGLAIASRALDLDLPMFTAPPVAALLMLLGCGGVRFQSRLFALERQRSRRPTSVNALIVGADSQGAALAYELSHTESGREVRVVGFVDDDSRMRRRSVRGIPVLGDTSMLDELCTRHDIDRIVVALPDRPKEEVKPIINRALRTSAQVQVLRSASDQSAGMLRNVRDLDLTDLLGRQPAPVDSDDIATYLEGATVLVTGAGGSIGSEISRQVARYNPARLLLVDRDESLLHDVAVGPLATAETILLDIRDVDRLAELFQATRPEVVFHAAANKHVPILERFPTQAATTNVAQHVAPGQPRRRERLSSVRAPLHRQGRPSLLGDGCDQASGRAGGGRRRSPPRPALRGRALRQRAREPRQRGADVPAPDPRRRAGDGHQRGDDPLLHDHPRGREPRAAVGRDGGRREDLPARHGRARIDPRPRPPDDPARRSAPRRGHQDRDHRHPARRAAARAPPRRSRGGRARRPPVDLRSPAQGHARLGAPGGVARRDRAGLRQG